MTDINMNYFTEIQKLAKGLEDKGIEYKMRPCHDGWQVLVEGDDPWDAVCHSGSYGHFDGLLEVMGEKVCRNEYDDVEGWLTAEDILARLE